MMREIGRAIARTLATATGTQRINAALSQFETIAAELEAGAAANREQIQINNVEIVALTQQNHELREAEERGLVVAERLRGLIAIVPDEGDVPE